MVTATTLRTFTQIALIAALAPGCATASGEVNQSSDATIRSWITPQASRTSDALTAAELSAAPSIARATAYDAVVRLRPGFLSPRNARTGVIAGRGVLPAVFIDGVFVGGVDALRGIAAASVAEMQYVRPVDASHRYGPEYRAGLILVRLRR